MVIPLIDITVIIVWKIIKVKKLTNKWLKTQCICYMSVQYNSRGMGCKGQVCDTYAGSLVREYGVGFLGVKVFDNQLL